MRGSATDPSTANRRTVAVAVVGLLVVLSGCLGAVGDRTPSPADQGDLADGASEVRSIEDGDLPPGVDESGVVNATRLLDAHRSQGLSDGYRVRHEPVAADGEGEAVVLDRGPARARLVRETADGITTYWASGEGRAVAVRDPSSTVTYATGASGAAGDLLAQSSRTETAVDPYVRYGEFDAVGVVEREDGQFLKLEATGIDAAALSDGPSRIAGDGQVLEIAGQVLVTSAGVIGLAELEVTVETGDGETVTDVFRYEVGGVEEAALERPDWTEETPHVEASLHEDGTALALTNRGGAAIPEGTELRLVADGEVLGTATVPERVEPDGRLYAVVVTGDDATTTVHVGVGEPPSVEGHRVSLGRYDGVVAVGYADDGRFEAGTGAG